MFALSWIEVGNLLPCSMQSDILWNYGSYFLHCDSVQYLIMEHQRDMMVAKKPPFGLASGLVPLNVRTAGPGNQAIRLVLSWGRPQRAVPCPRLQPMHWSSAAVIRQAFLPLADSPDLPAPTSSPSPSARLPNQASLSLLVHMLTP